MSKYVHFHFLIDKLAKTIHDWNSYSKIILINTILATMTSHIMASLPIPISTSTKVESLIHSFLWASKGQRGICWVKKAKESLLYHKGWDGVWVFYHFEYLSSHETSFEGYKISKPTLHQNLPCTCPNSYVHWKVYFHFFPFIMGVWRLTLSTD